MQRRAYTPHMRDRECYTGVQPMTADLRNRSRSGVPERAWTSLVLALGGLLAASCSAAPGGPSVRQGGTLYVALEAEPQSLNPLMANDATSRRAYTPLFPLLFAANTDLSVGPDLAAALPAVSDGGRTLTVTLRSNAKWSDGMPITADDVVFTVNIERDPSLRTHASFNWAPLAKVEKVDSATVKFRLSAPNAAFIANSLVTPIVPQHAFANLSSAQIEGAAFNANPTVTGGPFTFDHRDKGQLYLNVNTGYFLGRPHIDHIVEVVNTDPTKVLDQLENGKLSWVPVLAADAAGAAASTPGVTVAAYPATALDAAMFNVRPGHVFADAPVRQALASSLAHDALVSQATPSAQGYPVWGDINPNSWAFNQSAQSQYTLDANHARDLLLRDGWHVVGGVASRGAQTLSADLIFPSSDATRATAASVMATQSAAAGFRLTARPMDDAAFNHALTSGAFDAALVSVPAALDPDASPLVGTGGAENYGGYSNPSLDSLIGAELAAVPSAAQTLQQARKPIFNHIEQTLSTDLPLYFLWVPRQFTGFNATVNGVAGAGAQLDFDRADSFYRDWFLL